MSVLNKEIKKIVERRLFKASPSIKHKFPSSIADGSGFYVNFGSDKFHVIIFLNESERKPLEYRLSKGYDPFPGLIAHEDGVSSAFRFENSKNCVIQSCSVKNSYALSIGENSSIVIINHKQEIETKEIGLISYSIELGFIVSYSDEYTSFDIRDSFDDLISYYISNCRGEL